MYYPSWAGQPISLWTSIEANLAMICSCLPLLRPILVRFFRKMDLYGKGDRGLAYFSSKLKSGGSTLLNKTNVGGDESGSSDSKIQSEKAEGSTTSANSQNIMIHTTYEISHAKGEKPESESRYVAMLLRYDPSSLRIFFFVVVVFIVSKGPPSDLILTFVPGPICLTITLTPDEERMILLAESFFQILYYFPGD